MIEPEEYEDCITYQILDSEITFYADETAYGWNVIADYNNQLYYLGNQPVGILMAVNLWQEQNKRMLSQNELKSIMIDNDLLV